MSDPKRLSLECESDFEQMLLRAGRTEAPAGAKQSALLAVSAALALSSLPAGGAAAGQTAAAAKAGVLATLKWLSVVGAIAVGTVATAVHVHRAHRSSMSDAGATRVTVNAPPLHLGESTPAIAGPTMIAATPAAAEPVAIEATRALAPAAAPRVIARSVPRSAESSASPASALPVELAMLDRARSATSAGDTNRALSILDAYAVRFPRGAMAPEAAVLRVEALVKAGDRPGAMRFANAFLASAPHSPYATRIQSLLSASNP
jgi:hypothetical protein